MKGVIIKTLEEYRDDRGFLLELFRNDELGEFAIQPQMGYISMTLPGIVRGPHEHNHQTDVFIFLDDFEISLWDNRKDSPDFGEKIIKRTGGFRTLVIVPPNVIHGYKCMNGGPGLVLNFPDKLYKGEHKAEGIDEIRHENTEDSAYQIS